MKKTRNYRLICAMGVVCLLGTLPALASPIVIDFEDHAAMGYVTGTTVTEAAKLSDGYRSSYGVSFSSGDPYCAVVSLGYGHATSGTKGLGGSNAGKLIYSPDYPIVAAFFSPSNTSQMATTDFVSLRTDLWADIGDNMVLEGYDIYGQLIASDSATDTGGVVLSISSSGIHSVKFTGRGVAIDDFTFNPVTPIPEPATAGLIGGVAIGMYWIRHRFIV